MQLPFRTNKTWLTDAQLILLDAVFDLDAPLFSLRDEVFRQNWNLRYSHGLGDIELLAQLEFLRERGLLKVENERNQMFFCMTAAGGALWSDERCPVWERYCYDSYTWTVHQRTFVRLTSVSSQTRDEFMNATALDPDRTLVVKTRFVTVKDRGLIKWYPFDRVHVGLAIYQEKRSWTPEGMQRSNQHRASMEKSRSWWRCISELQRFVTAAT